jgi:hypothetical protein
MAGTISTKQTVATAVTVGATRRSAGSLGATLTPGDIAIEKYQGRMSIGCHPMPTMVLSK